MKRFKSEKIFLWALIIIVMGFITGCGLFEKTYTLDVFVNEEDGGSVNIDPQEEEYVSGTEVVLTAVAEEGWYFSEWQGDLSGSENPAELVMDSDKEVTAIFERLDYELTIDTEGEGEVEIIEVIEPQSGEYPYETVVKLEAVAEEGWYFSEWQGDLSGSENPTELVMDSDREVTAIFERLDYELTIDTIGEGEVEVIEVIEPQAGEYPYETVVKLRAVSGEGWVFSSWAGDMESNDPEISIIMDSAKSVIAEFEVKDEPSGFAGGEGTAGDPYLVGNAEQLNRIRDHLDKHFKQVGGIDLSVFSEGEGWETIGCSEGHFTGSFDGNGFIIQNLFINRPEEVNIGLFGIIGTDAEIAGVALEHADVTGERRVGSLVGNNFGSIDNCYATGMVKSGIGEGDWFLHTGGLVGLSNSSGEIVNSYAKVSVSSISDRSGYVGGLVGANHGEIFDSYATGNVEMTNLEKGSSAGGLVGENGGLIKNSYATGNVVGNSGIGGLVGFMEMGSITNSHATGNVEGNNGVGGLLGSHQSPVGVVSESYATGTVTGKEKVGGLVGESQQTIESCYAEGDVQGDKDVGGLVGSNKGSIEDSSATGQVISTGNNTGGLVGGNYADGLITGCHALGAVSSTGSFTGGLVGSNYSIVNNSYAEGNVDGTQQTGGLVGINFGSINGCYALGTVNSTGDRTGGLVGLNYETITNAYATGTVSGDKRVGGLVGENYDTITNTYAVGSVSGTEFIGGLVGANDDQVHNSYYDSETTRQDDSDGGEGRTTKQMKAGVPDIKLDENGNECDEGDLMYEDWDENIWKFGTDEDYPWFYWQQ